METFELRKEGRSIKGEIYRVYDAANSSVMFRGERKNADSFVKQWPAAQREEEHRRRRRRGSQEAEVQLDECSRSALVPSKKTAPYARIRRATLLLLLLLVMLLLLLFFLLFLFPFVSFLREPSAVRVHCPVLLYSSARDSSHFVPLTRERGVTDSRNIDVESSRDVHIGYRCARHPFTIALSCISAPTGIPISPMDFSPRTYSCPSCFFSFFLFVFFFFFTRPVSATSATFIRNFIGKTGYQLSYSSFRVQELRS